MLKVLEYHYIGGRIQSWHGMRLSQTHVEGVLLDTRIMLCHSVVTSTSFFL